MSMTKRQRSNGGGGGDGDNDGDGGGSNRKTHRREGSAPILPAVTGDNDADAGTDDATQGVKAKARARVSFGMKIDARLGVSEDRMVVTGFKGYRSAFCSHAVPIGTGAWFCEMVIEQLSTSKETCEVGHVRVGWGAGTAKTDVPVGFCKAGYAFRSIDGSKVHDAWREEFAPGECLIEGDVFGMLIHVGGESISSSSNKSRQRQQWSTHSLRHTSSSGNDDTRKKLTPQIEGSFVQFFRNGKDMGVAFRSLMWPASVAAAAASAAVANSEDSETSAAPPTKSPEGYFAVASLYQNATVRLNPGPEFKFPPALEDLQFRPLSDLAEANLKN